MVIDALFNKVNYLASYIMVFNHFQIDGPPVVCALEQVISFVAMNKGYKVQ